VPLIKGDLMATDYEDAAASDPRIDALRDKMQVVENPRFTEEYLQPEKRAIGNSVQVFFSDGSHTDKHTVDYPIGHRRRRDEGIPALKIKFAANLKLKIADPNAAKIQHIVADQGRTEATRIVDFMPLWTSC